MTWVRFGSFWIYPILILLLLSGSHSPQTRLSELTWLIPAGLLVWSLLEYLLHRFVFHLHPQSAAIHRLLHPLHGSHHQNPHDPNQVLVRLFYSLPTSVLLLGGLYWVANDLFRASGLLAGIWMGFLYYESIHYRMHQSTRSGGLIGRQRRHHFYHHFVDRSYCFGVTSPIWDWLLGTYRRLTPRSGGKIDF